MSAKRPRPWHDPTPLDGYRPDWAGQFDTFDDWVNHASRALTGVTGSVGEDLRPMCIDAKGRRCHVGKDFMRARDEGAFPIRYFWTFVAVSASDRTPIAPEQRERAFCVEKMAELFARGVAEGWIDLSVDPEIERDGRDLIDAYTTSAPPAQPPQGRPAARSEASEAERERGADGANAPEDGQE